MALYPHTSLSRTIVLNALEMLLNEALLHDAKAHERLQALDGTVIRVRIEQPDDVFFILIHADGVEILTEFDGYVTVRVRGALGPILQWWLVPNSSTPEHEVVRVLAPEEQLQLLLSTISEFSLWTVVRNWLDRYTHIDDLLALLRREDPHWFKHISTLPKTVEKLEMEVARQRLRHEDLADEVQQLKQQLRADKARDNISLVLAVLCWFIAVPLWQQQFSFTAYFSHAEQAVVAASLGVALLLWRMLASHRL
ncbi:MAG TPA: hypothetical protein VK099_09130 [Alcanivoracaceae bacterium]|nr:hypothetical protein [Alcanivoracaceae bacterium]